MVIRRILFVIAVLLIVVGVSQLVFWRWWINVSPSLVDSPSFHLWGMVGLLLGFLLLLAALEGVIGLRLFMALLGLYVLVSGAVLLVNPEVVRGLMAWILFDRSRGFQIFIVLLGGLIRLALGAAMIFALARAPRRTITHDRPGSSGPSAGTVESL